MWTLGLLIAFAGPPALPPLPGQSAPAARPAQPDLPALSGSEDPESEKRPGRGADVPAKPSNPVGSVPPPRPHSTPKASSGPTDTSHSASATRGSVPLAPTVQRPNSLDPSQPQASVSPSTARAANGGALPWAATDPPPLTFEKEPTRRSPDGSESPDLPGDGARRPDGSPEVVVRTASPRVPEPELTYRGRPRKPSKSAAFVLAYRQYSIVDRLDRRQMWHVASVEVTPLRRFFRLNLITEVGFEGGEAARGGDRADFQLVEKLGLGAQYPHWVTPFAEFQGGVGLARVELFERNDLVMVYTLGVDAGAQWAATRWLFLHAAIGWVRPHLRWSEQTLRYDSFTFKLGLGF